MIPIQYSLPAHKEPRMRFYGWRLRTVRRWWKSHTPPKTRTKEKARRAKQAGFAHQLRQSQELEARAAKFRAEKEERRVQLAIDLEFYREFMKTLKGSAGPRPSFRQWRAPQ